jgi:HD-GYP domain-containing protein (c-di-GMP phosphodiesterase class II)
MTNDEPIKPSEKPLQTAEFDPRMREEVEAVFWMFEQVRNGEPLPVSETEAVAHSLYVSKRLDEHVKVPQLPLHDMRAYNAVHAINVAMLSMSAAEALGMEERAVRAIGRAGLLHDIGMVRVPVELISKAEQLTDAERVIVTRHPIDGATIIVEAEATLDLAAVVAYEHHIKPDGSGYPALTYPRRAHKVARLVAVCDAYHALRSPRPFRDAWPADIVSSFLQQRAGFDFDADMVNVVTTMMREAESQQGHGT